jgi:type I restriction enzyme, S subunit
VRPMNLSLDDLRYTGMSLDEVGELDGLAHPGDLLFTRYSGNPQLVGACARVPDTAPQVAYPDKLIRVTLRPHEADSRFVEYAWTSSKVQVQVKAHIKTTAGQTGISGSSLRSIRLPVPPLDRQRRIACTLESVHAQRSRRTRAISNLNELKQAVFHEMFGGGRLGEHGWSGPVELTTLADVVSGITKGRRAPSAPLREVSYMAVSNVQDRHLNLDVVKTIAATEDEVQRYRLLDGDLLLTEGGDPDKLGRGTIWRNELPECIHQNHIFRVRLHEAAPIMPAYLNWLLASAQGKRYFLRSAKQTTGIASINATQLKGFPVPVPRRDLQQAFTDRLRRIDELRRAHHNHLAELDALFAYLQHRAINGEL